MKIDVSPIILFESKIKHTYISIIFKELFNNAKHDLPSSLRGKLGDQQMEDQIVFH